MATSDKDAAHRNVIKFCFDLGMTPVETQKKLQLTEDHRHVSRSLVYKWHKRFEDGWTDSLNGKSGRPREINASTVDNVNDMIRSDRRQTENRKQTENAKERRVVASREFLLKNQRDPTFLDRIITVDEIWLHYYDPEDKRQSCVWKTAQSPPPKKAKVTKSMGKNMFIVFLDRKGVILCHSVPHGETVNSAYYSKLISRDLLRALRKKRFGAVGFCLFSVSKETIERTAVWWFRRSQRCYLGNNKEDGQFLVSVGV